MSEALRALNDGLMDFDSTPGIEEPQSAPDEQQHVQEPDEVSTQPEGQDDPQEASPEPEQQPLSKSKERKLGAGWAKAEAERNRKLKADVQARDQQLAQMQQQFAQQQKQLEEFQRKEKFVSNPDLRIAADLIERGFTPEMCDIDAAQQQADGNFEKAAEARKYGKLMRELLTEQTQAKEAQQAQQAETAWRNSQYGTLEYDQAVRSLKPGSKEFNDAWFDVEKNLVKQKAQSQDPWDQECAKQFSDTKSEFGQRLSYFLTNTDFGRELAKNGEGMIPAFDICKMGMVVDYQTAEIRKLREENDRLRGHTSPSSGMPVNGNSYRGTLPSKQENPDDFYKSFERLGIDEMRRVLRSRETV